MLLWWLSGLLLLALAFPWRFHLLVSWDGGHGAWELGMWSRRLGGGRLRDLLASRDASEGRSRPKRKPTAPKPVKSGRSASLQRMALRIWRDRADLWQLFRFSNGTALKLLDVLTLRFRVVLAGLDPMDQGWIAVTDAVREGGGIFRKVKVLNDWDPQATGGAVRWEIGFCLAELIAFSFLVACKAPWRILWVSLRKSRTTASQAAKAAAHRV